jgi:hypothetical protein
MGSEGGLIPEDCTGVSYPSGKHPGRSGKFCYSRRRLAAAAFLTALTVLTRLTALTADRIDIDDIIDGGV